VTSTGSSGDLRKVMPIMVGASMNHIGGNTYGKVKEVLSESDEKVLFIQGRKNKK